jgi:altronate hydrolase
MKKTRPAAILLSDQDNVAVALSNLEAGSDLGLHGVLCRADIPAGHKVALRQIPPGDPVCKYGQIIGFAAQDISQGEHVHTHNITMGDFERDYAIGTGSVPTQYLPVDERATFEGFLRPDGRAATRNYVGVLATVNCSASVVRFIADALKEEVMADFPNVDGVVPIGHGTGCGMASQGEGFHLLQRTLAGWARNPNFAGVLLVGLGCEVNQIDCLMENMKLQEGPALKSITIQKAGGTAETVRQGVDAVRGMVSEADRVQRQSLPAGRLVIALECGGSDAYSGISANPALGAAVDLLVRQGGTAILSETPEIYGAEHLLTQRAERAEVGEKLIRRIRWWEDHTARLGGEINNNPTPGNKAGGLSTILEKSLGAAAKGGTTNLVEVYGYAEPVEAKGLVFMDTPGYDAVSVTGMVAGGAHLICFTTGCGTVCGFKPAPTIKLASNTEMFRRLRHDMDVNCGAIVDGEATIQEMGAKILDLILETASGRKTKSEAQGFGDNEFVPWQVGPVM